MKLRCLGRLCAVMQGLMMPMGTPYAAALDLRLPIGYAALAGLSDKLCVLEDGQRLYLIGPGQGLAEASHLVPAQQADLLLSTDDSLFGIGFDDGSLFEIDPGSGDCQQRATWQMLPWMDQGDGSQRHYVTPQWLDGVLYMAISGKSTGIAAFYPDGSQRLLSLPGEPSRVLAAQRDDHLYALGTYDEVAKLYKLHGTTFQDEGEWAGDTWALMWINGQQAWLTGEGSRLLLDGEPAAYLLNQPTVVGGPVLMADGRIALGLEDGVYIKALDTKRQQRQLSLHSNPFGGFREINEGFMAAYLDIVLTAVDRHFQDAEDFYLNYAASGIDVMLMGTQYEPWTNVRDKGYALPLAEGSPAADAVKAMFPAMQEAVSADGQVLGLPIALNGVSQSYYDQSLLTEYGFPESKLPTSLLDVPAFLSHWADNFMDRYPHVLLFGNQENARQALLAEFLQQYTAPYEHAGEAINFDTALFREGLAMWHCIPYLGEDATEAIWLANANVVEPLISEQPQDEGRQWLALPASQAQPYWLKGNLAILFINPVSSEQEAARAYLDYVAAHLPRSSSVLAKPQDNQPIEYAGYQEDAARDSEMIAALRAELPQAGAIQARSIESTIYHLEQRLNSDAGRYLASPDWIGRYRQLAEHLVIASQGFFDFNPRMPQVFKNVHDTLARYQAGQVDAEYVVQEFQRIERMRVMESR